MAFSDAFVPIHSANTIDVHSALDSRRARQPEVPTEDSDNNVALPTGPMAPRRRLLSKALEGLNHRIQLHLERVVMPADWGHFASDLE